MPGSFLLILNYMNNYLLFFLLILISSCSINNDFEAENNFNIHVLIDTIYINPDRSSQVGLFQWTGQEVLYLDQLYGFIEGYSPQGDFKGQYLKILNGPEELAGVSSVSTWPEGYLVKGEAWYFYLYDKDWNFIRKFFMSTDDGTPVDDLMNTPDPKVPLMYELQYYNEKYQFSPEGHVWVKLDTEHPLFNAFTNREYYRQAFVIGELDIEIGGLRRLLLTRPQSYEQYRYVPYHIFFDYHLSPSGKSWFTFEIDSLIYAYNGQMQQVQSFGRAGQGMKTNYPETDYLEAAFEDERYPQSRLRYGYYKDIYVDEEEDLVFRTYRLGSADPDHYDENQTPLRMQVYKGTALAGDFEVPTRFKILGKTEDGRYIADGFFDELNEKQGFYVFKVSL